MENPIQNPGYFGNQPSNVNENRQLNELEQSENRSYTQQNSPRPSPTPDVFVDPSDDSGQELPADSNIFDAVSQQYQNQIQQGSIDTAPDDSMPAGGNDSDIPSTNSGDRSGSESDDSGGDVGGNDGGEED